VPARLPARRLLPGVALAAAVLCGIFFGSRPRPLPATGDSAPSAPASPPPVGLGDHTLVRLGPEVRAAIRAPCPSDLTYPIGAARRVELAWGTTLADPASVRFKAVLRTARHDSRVLLDEAGPADFAAKPTWLSRVFDLPPEAEGGTLILRTRGASTSSFWGDPVFSRSAAPGPPRNVIVVSLDTVRADHLNAYGYTRRPTSPEFDAWAREGTLFEAAMSAAPGTLSSQMSILTGRYPSGHGVSYTNWRRRGRMPVLRLDTETLAEIVGPRGFLTAAFTGSGYFALPIGYSRGFAEFVSSDDETLGSAATVFEKGFAWLERHRGDPFFLFLHTYEAHEPYLDPRFAAAEGPRLKNEAERNEALYDGDIRRADVYLGKLRRVLERLDLAPRTLIVVLADHGEEFGDHFPVWNDGHGHSLYEEQVHVPLLLVGPLVPRGRRVADAVDLTAVVPTVLDFLGVSAGKVPPGRSLLPLLEGRGSDEQSLAFSEDVWIGAETRAVRSREWKLVERGERLPEPFVDRDTRRTIARALDALAPRMLFHMPSDPRERENRMAPGEPVAARLEAALAARLVRGAGEKPEGEIEVEGEVLERLRALGYVR
jgi:arylsulfatase A-like enzyme